MTTHGRKRCSSEIPAGGELALGLGCLYVICSDDSTDDDTNVDAAYSPLIRTHPSCRLLSAWKYCISKKDQVNQYRDHMTKQTKSRNHSWPAFYQAVASPLKLQNLHWRPQTDFCEWGVECMVSMIILD